MPSLLVIQIPPKPRLGEPASPVDDDASSGYAYVWSEDGRRPGRHGRAAASLLPRADSVVAVLPATEVAWHSAVVPKAPPARLRAALAGLLEESLLDDPEQVHFALAPNVRPGETGWVAVTHRGWLSGALAALEQAQVFVDRIAPAATPAESTTGTTGSGSPAGPSGHFALDRPDVDAPDAAALRLVWSHAAGVASVRLQGTLGRALLPQPLPPEAQFSATPAAATAAEAWLGAPVAVVTDDERLLQAALSPWNLRQFELVRRHRGTRALRDGWRAFRAPEWRMVRYGVVALVVIQLAGLNLWAWQLQRGVDRKQAEMTSLLQTSFPQVRGVLDAPLQMEREVQLLRGQAGRAGDADLEPLLMAAAAAWPTGRPPVESLRYEPGRLSLAATGWGTDEVERFRGVLSGGGYQVEQSDGRLHVRRAVRAAAS